jgi:hypothetical protein
MVLCLGTAQRDVAAAENKRTNRIKVLEATYGGNCTGVAAGNATTFVASACNDQDLCNYRVYYKDIGGDPAAGCDKEFRVTYSCGSGKSAKRETCAVEAEAGKGGEDGHPNRFCLLHCLATGTKERSRSKAEAAPRSGSAPRTATPPPRTAAPAPRAAPPPQSFAPPFDSGFRPRY